MAFACLESEDALREEMGDVKLRALRTLLPQDLGIDRLALRPPPVDAAARRARWAWRAPRPTESSVASGSLPSTARSTPRGTPRQSTATPVASGLLPSPRLSNTPPPTFGERVDESTESIVSGRAHAGSDAPPLGTEHQNFAEAVGGWLRKAFGGKGSDEARAAALRGRREDRAALTIQHCWRGFRRWL